MVVVAMPTVWELAVGICHSLNVPLAESKKTTLLPDDSVNQQHFPEGSRAKLTGRLFAVGTVHSVSV
jgi:hypothetical protein